MQPLSTGTGHGSEREDQLETINLQDFSTRGALVYVVRGREREGWGWAVVFPDRLLHKGVVRERCDVFKHADFVVGCF